MTSTNQRPKSRMKLVAGSSLIGTAIEWYDFFLYGTAAALVFNQIFYAQGDPFVATLLSLGTFSAGFIARPLGAIVLGHLGDRKGRKTTLVLSLVLMGIATCIIALVPTYAVIGVAAPIILLLLRLVQGFALGGEWAGSILLVAEHADDGNRRGFWSSLPNLGPPVGGVLAVAVMSLLSGMMSNQAFMDYGWRIAFGLSAVLVIVGLVMRLVVEETPVFEQRMAAEKAAPPKAKKIPLVEAFRSHWKVILLAAGVRMGENAGYYLYTVFILTYVTTVVGADRQFALNAVIIGQVVAIVLIPLLAALSDRIGRKPILLASSIATIPWGFAFFALLDLGEALPITLAAVGGLVIFAGFSSVIGAFYSELFPTEVRYTGTSVAYNLASILAGALSPIIALSLFEATGTGSSIGLYLGVMGIISLVSVLLLRETRNVRLSGGDTEVTNEPKKVDV